MANSEVFKRLMSSSAETLQEIGGSKSQFIQSVTVHTYRCLMVLVPESYKWESIWVNLYLPTEIPQTAPVGTTVIIHGHKEGETCYASTFCHILGYQPRDGGTKHWKMKWGTKRSATFVTPQFGKERQEE